ncbi:ATP-binding protein [soil metagenome]
MKIRTRLTLLFAILVAVVLAGAGAFVHIRFREDIRRTVDAGLSGRAQSLLAGVDDSGIQFGDEGNLLEPDQAFAQVVTADGELIESSPGLNEHLLLPAATFTQLRDATYFDVTVTASGETIEARVLAAPSEEGPIVIVAASLEEQNDAATRLTGALLLGGSGALTITTLIGWMVAGAALRPVERMRAEAAEISADEPGRRLRVPDTDDELARLSTTLNEMLARLEQAIEHERRFVDDASHELRTPLGILKTELELALRKARTPEELEAALRSAAEESDRLSSLAEDLLVLARSDHGRLPVRREEIDALELVREVTARFEPISHARDISIEIRGDTPTRANADPARLRQALSNLIDNALRHSPRGGSVVVRVDANDERLLLSIADDGSGFPTDFIDRAFEPFTRVDAARGRSGGGAGLGLAIVKAVAESHGGSSVASNRPEGGAVVSIEVPSH